MSKARTLLGYEVRVSLADGLSRLLDCIERKAYHLRSCCRRDCRNWDVKRWRNDRSHMIPVARPWMDEREADAARRAILSGWVTQGPEVTAFEREFAAAVDATHACAVSSCTTALHLALLSLGVGPGDEVITVSHSFIATTNAIRYCGATPVFVDVELATFTSIPHWSRRQSRRAPRRF
jgi:hypothetical protein